MGKPHFDYDPSQHKDVSSFAFTLISLINEYAHLTFIFKKIHSLTLELCVLDSRKSMVSFIKSKSEIFFFLLIMSF